MPPISWVEIKPLHTVLISGQLEFQRSKYILKIKSSMDVISCLHLDIFLMLVHELHEDKWPHAAIFLFVLPW